MPRPVAFDEGWMVLSTASGFKRSTTVAHHNPGGLQRHTAGPILATKSALRVSMMLRVGRAVVLLMIANGCKSGVSETPEVVVDAGVAEASNSRLRNCGRDTDCSAGQYCSCASRDCSVEVASAEARGGTTTGMCFSRAAASKMNLLKSERRARGIHIEEEPVPQEP